MTKANPIEKDVKRQGKALLEKHGWFHWMPPANTFGKSGISDLHAVKPGVFMVVEFKIGKGKPTELQKAFLTMIDQANHLAFVVNDTNMSYFQQFLEAFDRAAVATASGGEKAVDPVDGSLMINAVHELTKDFADTLSRFQREGNRAVAQGAS